MSEPKHVTVFVKPGYPEPYSLDELRLAIQTCPLAYERALLVWAVGEIERCRQLLAQDPR